MRWAPRPSIALRYIATAATSVLPSPVFSSAILPSWRALAPISCTSKARWPSLRRIASRTTANASGRRSSRVSPSWKRRRSSPVLARRPSSSRASASGSRSLTSSTRGASFFSSRSLPLEKSLPRSAMAFPPIMPRRPAPAKWELPSIQCCPVIARLARERASNLGQAVKEEVRQRLLRRPSGSSLTSVPTALSNEKRWSILRRALRGSAKNTPPSPPCRRKEPRVLRTPLCDLLDIDHPIIQAGMGIVPSAALVAAVSNAGALGTFSTFMRPIDDTRRQLAMIRNLTARPFAVNHVVQAVDEETFALGLSARPKLVSMALADPGDFVRRAHDAGALFMQQVTTVAQAIQAAERGVDIIVAQGGEAGGYGGSVATLVLVPQVVDAVRPIPVVAAGGIFDGRGLAAALVLGAEGVNVGTRFLASEEAAVSDGYKHALLAAS